MADTLGGGLGPRRAPTPRFGLTSLKLYLLWPRCRRATRPGRWENGDRSALKHLGHDILIFSWGTHLAACGFARGRLYWLRGNVLVADHL